jgi:MFS family permease
MSQSVEARPRSLWRDRNFLTMWSGQTLSQFGEQISLLGVPVLAVVLLHSTAFEVGVLNASGLAAFLLIGLPAGAWIDRMRKRHVMIAADIVRALALAAIPVLWSLGMLHIWQLYAVAFVIGVATVFFDVSYQSLTPSLVPAPQIAEANGKLEATAQVAHLTGPAIAGWLIGVVSAPFAMIATAGTYAASFVALAFTRDSEQLRPAHEHGRLVHEIGEGLRWVFGNRALRRIVATTGTSNLFNTISVTILPLFLLRELGMTPQAMGLILSLGAVGGLLGAIATPHLVRRVGEGPAIPLSALAFSLVSVFLPIAAMVPQLAFPLLVVQGFVMSFFVLVYNITQVTFRQRITPPRLLGRMNASIRFVVWGVMPIASLAAGALATWLGIVPTMWIGAAGQLASAVFVVTGPFWAMRQLPT